MVHDHNINDGSAQRFLQTQKRTIYLAIQNRNSNNTYTKRKKKKIIQVISLSSREKREMKPNKR